MIRSPFLTLRARLLLLVMLAAIPVFGLTLYTGLTHRQQAITEAQAEALRVVRLASFYQARALDSAHQLLIALSHVPEVQSGNAETCSAFLAGLLQQYTVYASFSVTDLDGNALCSALPLNEPTNLANQPYFQKTLATQDFVVGRYQIGDSSGTPILSVSYPVFDTNDNLQGIVIASIDLAWFNQLVSEAQLPMQSVVTMIDHNGLILARFPDSEAWVGKSFPDAPLIQTLLNNTEGIAELAGLDSVFRLYGFTTLQGGDENAHITIGIPTAIAYQEANRVFQENLLGISLELLLLLALTWVLSDRFVLRSVGALVAAARKLSDGNLTHRLDKLDGPAEMRQLGQAFDEMAESLQLREAEAYKMQDYLQRYVSRLEALHEIDQAMLTTQSATETAKAALNRLKALVVCRDASIALLNLKEGKGKVIATSAGQGVPIEEGAEIELDIATIEQELLREEMRVVEDLLALPQRTKGEQRLADSGVRAYHLLPLTAQSELIGVLSLTLDQPGRFPSEEVEVAQEIAAQLAVALQTAQLFEEIKRHVEELEQRVKERTVDLQRTKEHVETILNNSSDAIILARADGTIQQTNPAFQQLFGYQAQEMYGKKLLAFVRFDHSERLIELLHEVVVTRKPKRIELVCYRSDGRTFDADFHISRTPERDSKSSNIICSVRDITERKRTEAKFRGLLESAPDAMVIVNQKGIIVLVNKQTEKLFGYSAEELIGQSVEVLVPQKYRQKHFEQRQGYFPSVHPRAMESGLELYAQRKDGSQFPAEISLSPLETEEGILISSAIRDITARKRLEDDLRRALENERELNELRARFVSMLSHDFRTPMAVIQSSAGLLRDYTDRMTEDKKRIHLEKIQIQIKQLDSMLDDTLILMKAQTVGIQFEPKPLDAVALCQAIVKEIQQTTTQHQIVFDSSEHCGEALLDEKLMRQIITNLLSNAVKYSPNGGTVNFDLRCENGEIVLKIKDAGIGIPEADQATLFEAFHRARNVGDISGTGLGLAIVKQAVDAHGGSITFKSEMGVGTTFVVTLPNPL